MILKKVILLSLLLFIFNVRSQLLFQVCDGSSSSGILIQQVDKDWNKVPFDCQNIEVSIKGESFESHIRPGELYVCKYKFGNTVDPVISILGEQPGIYDFLVKRFDEERYFQAIKVEWDESGCDVKRNVLEVNFDMSKQAKEQ